MDLEPRIRSLPARRLDLRWIDRRGRRVIEPLVSRFGTVGEVLDHLDPHLGDLVRALALAELPSDESSPPGPAPAEDDAPPVGASGAEWRAWLREHFAEDLFERRIHEVVGARAPWPPHWEAVSRALVGALRPPAGVRSSAAEVRARIVALALERATLTARAQERERLRRVRPPEPLAAWWSRLHALRDAEWDRRLALVPRWAVSHASELELVLHDDRHETRFDLETGQLRHPTEARVEAWEAVLDWIVTPSAERERVVAALVEPAWRRALRRVVDASAVPPLPPDDDKREVGFVLDLAYGLVDVVRVREKRRGDGYVMRRVTGPLPEALAAADPGAAEIAALVAAQAAEAALLRLVGRPRVFVGRGSTPVAVRRGRLALGLRRRDGGVRLAIELDGREVEPGWLASSAWTDLAVTRGDGELVVAPLPPALRRVAHSLLRGVPEIPAAELPALAAELPALSAQVPLDADRDVLGTPLAGDDRPLVALSWEDDRLRVVVRVQPLPESAPQVPGAGSALTCGRRGETLVHHVRDLVGESERVRGRLEPLGLRRDREVAPYEWVADDVQQALGLVTALRAASGLRLGWTGDRLTVGEPIGAASIHLRVESQQDWFGVGGEAETDGGRVDLGVLFAAALAGHAFVPVSKGHWVALDDALRARLAAVAAASPTPGAVTVSALHAGLLGGLVDDGASLDAPPAWLAAGQRIRAARTLAVPVPAGLVAELRPYQEVGAEWLARLAHWAPGAVLADDMGLGKTLQAITLLLRRSTEGPALVVAPTSLVGNWLRELGRFAPSLRATALPAGAARATHLAALGPGDVVVATYGVVAGGPEPFVALSPATLVLDEAQAIKNPDAQRSRAIQRVRAGFTLALSGTPVENHVEELWSLFHAVAPGLLGSLPSFRSRFVDPIDGGDTARRAALAAMVGPFVLRRTKAGVLPELPPRTDIELRVELGADELALYHRARLESLARIATAGRRKMVQVLEELGRLRRQACHPRLVDPTSDVRGAKCQTAARLLRDLREGGHKVLVFSTMIAHLELVREALEPDGFRWCWLDGSTPPKRRLAEVDRFQAGEADAFLISLKAGGVGLNLTAADYVLHLDPWWNPAAEDQASDRAHRIGQERPVTVYRLVSAGTVEEQIVALHAHKRELADAVLAGSGSADLPDAAELETLLLGSRGDAAALAVLEKKGRPTLRVVDGEPW